MDYQVNTPVENTEVKDYKGKAVASLVCGICSVVVAPISAIMFVLTFVFASQSKKKNGGKMPGMSLAGIICAVAGLIIGVILTVATIIGVMAPQFVKYKAKAEEAKYEQILQTSKSAVVTTLRMTVDMMNMPDDGDYKVTELMRIVGDDAVEAFLEIMDYDSLSDFDKDLAKGGKELRVNKHDMTVIEVYMIDK